MIFVASFELRYYQELVYSDFLVLRVLVPETLLVEPVSQGEDVKLVSGI